LFVVLFVLSGAAAGAQPDTSATGATVIAYAKDHQNGIRFSAILVGLSLFVGLLFYGQVRHVLRQDPDSESWAAIAFGGAILFATGGGVVSGVGLALSEEPGKLDPGAAQALNLLYMDIPLVLFVGVGILMFFFGVAIVRSRLLPTWVGWLGLVCGVVALLPVAFFGFAGATVWTLAVSIILILRPASAPAASPQPVPAR
jgi:hypothetical protein